MPHLCNCTLYSPNDQSQCSSIGLGGRSLRVSPLLLSLGVSRQDCCNRCTRIAISAHTSYAYSLLFRDDGFASTYTFKQEELLACCTSLRPSCHRGIMHSLHFGRLPLPAESQSSLHRLRTVCHGLADAGSSRPMARTQPSASRNSASCNTNVMSWFGASCARTFTQHPNETHLVSMQIACVLLHIRRQDHAG